ncbi:hypothetical protein KAI32_01350 [Candidatus Pacearchaeota archaeon]|nr:hypothetical protein [Candidatus Pacearchaeota archaeon]
MKKPKIGVDFDGVVVNTGELQKYVARELFEKNISPSCHYSTSIREGYLTNEEARRVINETYKNQKYLHYLKEQPNAKKTLMNLVDSGFPLEIITAREGKEFDFAQKWLKQNGIYIPVKSTLDGEDKTKACNGLDVYVEDIPYQANSLKEVVPRIVLFNSYDNKESILTDEEKRQIEGIERISDWNQFKL